MHRFRLLLRKTDHFRRFYCSASKFKNINDAARFFSPLLNIKESAMYSYLTRNTYIVDLEPDEVRRKLDYFRYLNASSEEILEHPHLLTVHLITLENRSTILRECGFVETLNLATLSKYITLVRQRVKMLKINRLIPGDLDMVEQLGKQFDGEVCPPGVVRGDDQKLQPLREAFMTEFIRRRLDLSEVELKRLWKSYSKIKHKSFGHTQRVLDILEHDYKFSRDKIVGNLYLLHADPENLLRYPQVVPSIGGTEIRKVLAKLPKIMMVHCERVRQMLDLFQKEGINEVGVLRHITILTLAPDTVRARIEQIKKTKEFEVLLTHPRIAKLIAYQTKAIVRLDFLQQLKVRCASLNVLASHSQSFEKYIRDGCDRTRGRDIVHLLVTAFDKQEKEVRELMKRHQNWYHIPTIQIQETLSFLREKGYQDKDIYENVQILLYPITKINQKLEKLEDCKRTSKVHDELGMELTRTSPAQILALCLYMIELDFHFTGDGVWPEQVQLSDSTTTTNIELPKTLNKDYKFGKKAASVANGVKV